MRPPEIKQITKADGSKIYRVAYAGMIKEHRQDWQAEWHYRQACEMYVQHLASKRSEAEGGR